MSRQVLTVVVVVVATLGLLTVTQAIVLRSQTTTSPTDYGKCSASVNIVPVFRLAPPDSSPLDALDTLTLPHTTTQPHLYTQPHGTTSPTPPTTTIQHPQTPIPLTPTPTKTERPLYISKKHSTLHNKLQATPHIGKHDFGKLGKTQKLLNTDETKSKLPWTFPENFPPSSASTFFSLSFSTSTTASPPASYLPTPHPSHPPHTSTLPPLPPTLPLPTVPTPPSSTPTLRLTLQQIEEKLNRLLGQHIPHLAKSSGWTTEFQQPYSQRIKAVNHELVDKILQSDYDENTENPVVHENTSRCHLPESRMSALFHKQTLLYLLLQALPQSLKEVEDAARDPEITDYIFRPEKRAVFDMQTCRQCYVLDASGVCREMFFCKSGQDVFARQSRRRAIVG